MLYLVPHRMKETIAARLDRSDKRRLDEAARKAGQTSSEFIRLALEEFFQKNPTTEAQIAAVIRSKAEAVK